MAAVAWAGGPEIRFDRLGLEEGLSQVSVVGMVQDVRGFLWIATQDGLNRFDGHRVEVFDFDPDDPSTPADSLLFGLFEDADGLLWITGQTPGALTRYDPWTERFTRVMHRPDDPTTLPLGTINGSAMADDGAGGLWIGTAGAGLVHLDKATLEATHFPASDTPGGLAHGSVNALHIDRQGTLWIGTSGGLQRLPDAAAPHGARAGEVHFESIASPTGAPPAHQAIVTLYGDADGMVWIGTAHGLDRWDPQRRVMDHFHPDPDQPDALPGTAVFGLADSRPMADDGHLWALTNRGLARFDAATETFTHFPGYPGRPTALVSIPPVLWVDREGVLWVGTQGSGLLRYDREHAQFHAYLRDPYDPSSLASDTILSLYESRDGILWIGTSSRGVDRYSRTKHKFGLVRQHASNPDGLADNMVFAFHQDSDGDLWVGTQGGGLHRFGADGETVVERYARQTGVPQRNLPVDWVRTIHEDDGGRLWVGTVGGGLAVIDRQRGAVVDRFTVDPARPDSLPANLVFDLFGDSCGELWVGTSNGWARFDRDTRGFETFRNVPGDPTSLPANTVRLTFEDREGRLWVGHSLGLSLFDRRTKTFQSWTHDPNDRTSLSGNNVMDIHQDTEGLLWIAIYAGGLNLFDPDRGTFRRFDRRDGLSSDMIYGILSDHEDMLWLSSNNGLMRFDPGGGPVEHFTVDDGVQSSEFNGRSFLRTAEGELLFGGVHGFNRFDPRDIQRSTHVPPVVLTDFYRLDQRQRFDRALDTLDRIEVSWRDDFLAFEFAALDYALPNKTRYRYQLQGFDHGWVDAGHRRRATYTNLDGGTYTFRVQGASGDGVWNIEGASVDLVVVPPPWKTWWAYLLYTALAVAGVLGILRYQQREADSRRRQVELERARRLQLSMLPPAPPQTSVLEIAVHMQTATEVGGDYYDFFPQPDGSLYVVTGDATGHGLSAGMMVAMTKSSLKALDVSPPEQLLGHLNGVIRAVNPERLNMALAVAHLDADTLAYSSAGMPPALLYRATSGDVEELLVPGIPLGGLEVSQYSRRREPWGVGDVLVLASDGLVEHLAERDDDGYGRLRRTVAEHARGTAQALLEALVALGPVPGRAPEDDVTVLVVKRQGPSPTPPPPHRG